MDACVSPRAADEYLCETVLQSEALSVLSLGKAS